MWSFRGSLLRNCWRSIPSQRPAASEIVDFFSLNPRLISPCIDIPLAAAVEIETPTPLTSSAETSGEMTAFYLPMAAETTSLGVECDCEGYCRPEAKQELQTPLIKGNCVQPGHYHCL